ncbi:MAG: Ig-like domain repeat protein [Saccharofermentanales bacterium]
MNMKRFINRLSLFLTVLLASIISFSSMPSVIFNNPDIRTLVLAAIDWNIGTDGDLLITGAGSYYVSGTTTSNTIKVQTTSPVTVTLNNVTIDVSASQDECAFDSGKNVTLLLNGINILKSANRPGIKVESGEILTIGNAGSSDASSSVNGILSSTGGGSGAGIGNDNNNDCGDIIINSGTISAFGGYRAPGIGGSSKNSNDTLVTITGGSVKAVGSTDIEGIATNGFSSVSLRIIADAVDSYDPKEVDYSIPVTSNGYRYDYSYKGAGHGDGDTNLYFYLPAGEFTTTTLKSGTNPTPFGSKATFTASVSPSSASGFVEFFDGSISIGTSRISNGTAVLATNTLSAGTHKISAIYDSAEGYFGSKSGFISQIINKRSVSLKITYDRNNIKYGEKITFTVSISPSEATGCILFYDGSNLFGICKISNGKTSLATDTLESGTLKVKAKYSGNHVFAGSITNPVSITVIGTNSINSAISGITPTLPVTPTKPASILSSGTTTSNISASIESEVPDSSGIESNESMSYESEAPRQIKNINIWVFIIFVSLLIISITAWMIISRKNHSI